jgi:hypothetical protein
MNKNTFIIIALFLLIISVFLLVQGYGNLKSQVTSVPTRGVIAEPEKPAIDTSSCERFSEDQANDCFEQFALKGKDADICEKITKTTKRKTCEREVELGVGN